MSRVPAEIAAIFTTTVTTSTSTRTPVRATNTNTRAESPALSTSRRANTRAESRPLMNMSAPYEPRVLNSRNLALKTADTATTTAVIPTTATTIQAMGISTIVTAIPTPAHSNDRTWVRRDFLPTLVLANLVPRTSTNRPQRLPSRYLLRRVTLPLPNLGT